MFGVISIKIEAKISLFMRFHFQNNTILLPSDGCQREQDSVAKLTVLLYFRKLYLCGTLRRMDEDVSALHLHAKYERCGVHLCIRKKCYNLAQAFFNLEFVVVIAFFSIHAKSMFDEVSCYST